MCVISDLREENKIYYKRENGSVFVKKENWKIMESRASKPM